jgi:hypothetical protein
VLVQEPEQASVQAQAWVLASVQAPVLARASVQVLASV